MSKPALTYLLSFPSTSGCAAPRSSRRCLLATWHITAVWDSFEQSTAREGTPSHAEMVRKLDALTDDPSRKLVLHMRFSDLYDPPLGCVESPVTELDLGFIKEDSVVAEWDRRAESLMSHMRRIHAEGQEGLRALTLGRAVEDMKRSLYLVGWDRIEVCFSCVACLRALVLTRLYWGIGDTGSYEDRDAGGSWDDCERGRGDLSVIP